MDFKKYLIKFRPDISLPKAQGIAATPVESIAPDDPEVECMYLFMLQAQGKLFSLRSVLEELEKEL